MASGDDEDSSTFLSFLRDVQKYVLAAVVGGLCSFIFQYKWWYEQEKLATAKDQYNKSYQTIIDFSELYHKRFYAVNSSWRSMLETGTVNEERKKLLSDLIYEWNFKIDTYIKQFETLVDRPFFEDRANFNPQELSVSYENWKDVDCSAAFEGDNGADARWNLIRFYPKAFDHCFGQVSDTLEGFVSGKLAYRKGDPQTPEIDAFLRTYETSYHNMVIFRQEALKRALCNYNEKTTDDLATFIGLWSKGLARESASCQVAKSHQEAKALPAASETRRQAAPPASQAQATPGQ